MKRHLIIAFITITSLSACTHLSEEDRSLLMETHSIAQEAREASIDAAEQAALARQAAAQSAAEAKSASDKADRIFRQSQNK